MENYTPPYRITDEILNSVSSISEKVGRITSTSNLTTKPHLRKNNRIQSIYSSLRIEANSLQIGQVRDVINGKKVIGEQKEIQEVKNAFEAYSLLSSIDPFNINDLKKMHGIMTRYLIQESGEFRKGEEDVFDGDTCIFVAPPAAMVPSLMEQLFQWMKESCKTVHPLILSCVFHYEFVFIHPFSDGNGRIARMWHTAILSKWNPIFEYIPIESQIERFQSDYYNAISTCHREGESTKFIQFMLKQIDAILDEVIDQVKKENAEYSDCIRTLLDAMEYDIPYSTKQLMEMLDLKSRDGFRRNYLKPALEADLIHMTQPDNPTSRTQKYIKL